jgi:hypothetical protein
MCDIIFTRLLYILVLAAFIISLVSLILTTSSITLTTDESTQLNRLLLNTSVSDSGCLLAKCFSDNFENIGPLDTMPTHFDASKGIVTCKTVKTQTLEASFDAKTTVIISSDGVQTIGPTGVTQVAFGAVAVRAADSELVIVPGLIQSTVPLDLDAHCKVKKTFRVGIFTTAARLAILNPENGTMVYDSDLEQLTVFQSDVWIPFTSFAGVFGENDGLGEEVFNFIIGDTLHFRTLTHDNFVALTSSPTEIEIAVNADSANTPGFVVARDGSGGFFAGVITASSLVSTLLDFSGVLAIGTSTATSLSLSKSGVTTTVNGALTVAELVTLSNLGLGVVHSSVSGVLTSSPVANAETTATSSSSPNTIVLRDGSSGFAAGNITASSLVSTLLDFVGVISIGTTNATSLSLSKSGGTTTVNGLLTVSQSVTLSNLGLGIVHSSVSGVLTSGPVANSETTATSSSLPNTIVLRDSASAFSAGAISLSNASSGTIALQVNITGDTNPRFETTSGGGLLWGSGSASLDTSLVRSSANTLTIGPNLLISGFEQVGSYSRIGSLIAPLNTTAGDISATRLMVGTDTSFGSSAGEFVILNGTDLVGGGGVARVGMSFSSVFAPSTTLSAASTGVILSNAISGNSAITGTITSASALTTLGGSGDITRAVGMMSGTSISGNSASNHGLLTVSVGSNPGTGYSVNDVLAVVGGTSGTVTVSTIGAGGSVASVSITHPGSGYTVSADNATTGGTGVNAQITILTRGSTTISTAVGMQSQAVSANGFFVTPTITTGVGFQVADSDLGSGPATMGTQKGLEILALNAATTNNSGIVIQSFASTSATASNLGIDIKSFGGTPANNVGVRIATPSGGTTLNRCLQFVTQSTIPEGGILFGSGADATQANLYRSAAGRLRCDGEFQALHFLCVSGLPTVALGAGVAASSVTVTAGSTDAGLQVTIVLTGISPLNATLYTVTYSSTYSSASQFVVYSAANVTAAALVQTATPFVSATTTTTFTFKTNAVAMPAGTYVYNFSVRA